MEGPPATVNPGVWPGRIQIDRSLFWRYPDAQPDPGHRRPGRGELRPGGGSHAVADGPPTHRRVRAAHPGAYHVDLRRLLRIVQSGISGLNTRRGDPPRGAIQRLR